MLFTVSAFGLAAAIAFDCKDYLWRANCNPSGTPGRT
jgi:hypothetical protein